MMAAHAYPASAWPTRAQRPERIYRRRPDPTDSWPSIIGRCLTVAGAIVAVMLGSATDPPGNGPVVRVIEATSIQGR